MPIYEYSCPSCGKGFEELTGSAKADRVRCPACGVRAVRKPSVFGVAMAPAKSSAPAMSPACQGCQQPGGSCPYK